MATTAISAGRLAMDALNYATKEPPVVIKTAECGNIEPIKLSRNDTDGTKQQVLEQAIRLEKLCPDE